MRRDSTAVAKRATRALDSFFHVESGIELDDYHVHSGSGSTYTVTLPGGTCTCPDGQRGPWCKHALRALFVTGHAPEIGGTSDSTETAASETTHHTEPTGTDTNGGTKDGDSCEMLAERFDRSVRNNPDASAIDAIGQLGIDPTNRKHVEELLAQ